MPSKPTPSAKKTAKPKTPRRFKAASPELATVYDSVTEMLYQQKDILKPFEYDFDEKSQTHTLVYESCLKFVKKEGNRRIDVYKKEKNAWVVWEENGPSGDFRLMREDGEVINTPIMWPVTCTNQSLARHLHAPISTALRQHERDVPASARHALMGFGNKEKLPAEVLASAEFNKELHKLNVALTAIWNGKTKRFRFANQRSGVCKWWEKFVDREILKMFVSVLGSSKNSCLSWTALALATQDPEIDNTIKHVKNLGGERVLLRSFASSEWKNKKTSDLLPPVWEKVWHKTHNLPAIVQKNMAITAFQYGVWEQTQSNTTFDWPEGHQKSKNKQLRENIETLSNDLQAPIAFYIFEHYKKERKWSARELDMLFRFSSLMADEVVPVSHHPYQATDTSLVLKTKAELDQLLAKNARVPDFISSYRQCCKDDFKKWSATHQSRFSYLSGMVFRSWLKGEEAPSSYNSHLHAMEGLNMIMAKMEEIGLTRELQETIKAKKAQEKRAPAQKRVM